MAESVDQLATSAALTAPSSDSASICSQQCILAFSLSSAGLVVAALLMSAFIVHRRRRTRTLDAAKARSRAQTEKAIEDGAFLRYLSPTSRRAPALSHRLDEDLDEDLVDVLDLFDPPARAHLKSPGPRKLTLPEGGSQPSHWGQPWRFLSSTSTDEDKVGIQTMLAGSTATSSVPSYAARTPVLVPRNLDTATPPRKKSLANAVASYERPRSMVREKRPPPLQLHQPGQSAIKGAQAHLARTSYISITSQAPVPTQGKPALSPITPLLTPPMRSPAPKLRVPTAGQARRPTLSRGSDVPQELARRSIDGAW